MKEFCEHQILGTDEGKEALLCCAHLAEGRCFVCRFDSLEAAKTRNANGGCCEDAEPPEKPNES